MNVLIVLFQIKYKRNRPTTIINGEWTLLFRSAYQINITYSIQDQVIETYCVQDQVIGIFSDNNDDDDDDSNDTRKDNDVHDDDLERYQDVHDDRYGYNTTTTNGEFISIFSSLFRLINRVQVFNDNDNDDDDTSANVHELDDTIAIIMQLVMLYQVKYEDRLLLLLPQVQVMDQLLLLLYLVINDVDTIQSVNRLVALYQAKYKMIGRNNEDTIDIMQQYDEVYYFYHYNRRYENNNNNNNNNNNIRNNDSTLYGEDDASTRPYGYSTDDEDNDNTNTTIKQLVTLLQVKYKMMPFVHDDDDDTIAEFTKKMILLPLCN